MQEYHLSFATQNEAPKQKQEVLGHVVKWRQKAMILWRAGVSMTKQQT